MEIKELTIKNYKSIRELTLKNPNPFSVFVGPNAAGKSNIFEALEFYNTISGSFGNDIIRLFSEFNNYNNELIKLNKSEHEFIVKFKDFSSNVNFAILNNGVPTAYGGFFFKPGVISIPEQDTTKDRYWENVSYLQFFNSFSRIFVGNEKIQKFNFNDDKRLSLSCGNLESVLKRVLQDQNRKAEITEWLELLIPGFKSIDVKTEELSGSNNLLIYENSLKKPITKKMISDGTYNIIAILTALYQTDEPQFLCIEEPENGLNPKVVKELVTIFRQQCKEKGHFIWLNTHSQSIVSELTSDEIILVDKVEGETRIKQIQGMDLHGMRMDEALLTNAIGGGIPW